MFVSFDCGIGSEPRRNSRVSFVVDAKIVSGLPFVVFPTFGACAFVRKITPNPAKTIIERSRHFSEDRKFAFTRIRRWSSRLSTSNTNRRTCNEKRTSPLRKLLMFMVLVFILLRFSSDLIVQYRT